jgi:hypothetical protein
VMATPSKKLLSRKFVDELDERRAKHAKEEKKEEKEQEEKLWTCSNLLLGKCEEHDYKEKKTLDENKQTYWRNEKDCRQYCGLPEDLMNIILEKSDIKTRSTFRNLAPSVRSLIPPEFLMETEKEKQKRQLYNRISQSCVDINRITSELSPNFLAMVAKKDEIKTLQEDLISNELVDRELLMMLLMKSIEDDNCFDLFVSLNNVLEGDPEKLQLLTNEDWFQVLRKIIDSKSVEKYLLEIQMQGILPIDFIRDFFFKNLSYFDKYTVEQKTLSYLMKNIVLEKSLFLLGHLLENSKFYSDYLLSDLIASLKRKIKINFFELRNAIQRVVENQNDADLIEQMNKLEKSKERYENDLLIFEEFAPTNLFEKNELWPSFPEYPKTDDDYRFIRQELYPDQEDSSGDESDDE